MSNSHDRFYQLEFRNRPVLYGDIGSVLRIEGLVVGGAGARAILLTPESERLPITVAHTLTLEEWSDFIKRSDDPEVLVGPAKVFQRKLRYQISGAVQQRVWAADGFKCVYCGRKMGEAKLLTVDHFVPLELGGVNDTRNYVTSCSKCNKDKGSEDPAVWCSSRGLDYGGIVAYLKNRVI